MAFPGCRQGISSCNFTSNAAQVHLFQHESMFIQPNRDLKVFSGLGCKCIRNAFERKRCENFHKVKHMYMLNEENVNVSAHTETSTSKSLYHPEAVYLLLLS